MDVVVVLKLKLEVVVLLLLVLGLKINGVIVVFVLDVVVGLFFWENSKDWDVLDLVELLKVELFIGLLVCLNIKEVVGVLEVEVVGVFELEELLFKKLKIGFVVFWFVR